LARIATGAIVATAPEGHIRAPRTGSSVTAVAPDDDSRALDVVAGLPRSCGPSGGLGPPPPGRKTWLRLPWQPSFSFGAHYNRLHDEPHRRSPQSLEETENISTDNMPGCSRTRATIRCWLCTSRRRSCDGLSERVAERTGTPLADAAVVSLSPLCLSSLSN
jgi:hypothetical protein